MSSAPATVVLLCGNPLQGPRKLLDGPGRLVVDTRDPALARHALETMAGKGSEVGGTFEEIRAIIDAVEAQLPYAYRLGVCLDTCHVWDGGFDIVNDLDGVLKKFDSAIGLDRLHAIHLNDSLNARASHKDRHACIGKGKIGLDALIRVINHPLLRDLPFYLETPNDLDGYRNEIALLSAHRAD